MIPRIALFTDCFHEVNGVALTCRRFLSYARSRGLPFLCVHPGPERQTRYDGSVAMVELGRTRFSFGLDRGLRFDLAFALNRSFLRRTLESFQPDLIHITSPGDCGILGAILARELRIPLAASWHTNLHQFAGRRLEKALWWLPGGLRRRAAQGAEKASLKAVLRFYALAELLFAPNPELVAMLGASTGRPVRLMRRGVDTSLYNPLLRDRTDEEVVIGYVGRLTAEKNVRLLRAIEQALADSGVSNYRFELAGQGSELDWLRANLRQAVFHGVLRGRTLARAYANMDIFAFPSRTDTYGNVVQEALASGVPVVATDGGGPKFLLDHGRTGMVCRGDSEFVAATVELVRNAHLRARLRTSVRASAGRLSWQEVFDGVYEGYAARAHLETRETQVIKR